MDRIDHLQSLGRLADELKEDLWPVRTGKISKGEEVAYIVEMVQRFSGRFSDAIDNLVVEEKQFPRSPWWHSSSVAAGAAALLTLAAVNAFSAEDRAYAAVAVKPVSTDDMVSKGLSQREWTAAPVSQTGTNGDDR